MAIVTPLIVVLLCVSPSLAYRGAAMGVANQACDDAQTHLQVDWPEPHYVQYTCNSNQVLPIDQTVTPTTYDMTKLGTGFDPRRDIVWHKCMNESIAYPDPAPPVRGDHRPLWAVYGEYLYLPEQRWLHNLEHGSIIMLYHPCANRSEVQKLRQLVRGCLYRHIITPYRKLSLERPLALVSWGSKLEMNSVDENAAVNFIKTHAHIAPEDISKQGQYQYYLIKPADIVSTLDDHSLCPSHSSNVPYNVDGFNLWNLGPKGWN